MNTIVVYPFIMQQSAQTRALFALFNAVKSFASRNLQLRFSSYLPVDHPQLML